MKESQTTKRVRDVESRQNCPSASETRTRRDADDDNAAGDTSSTEGAMCRICWEGHRRPEQCNVASLQRFCWCRGSVALCHGDCLTEWVLARSGGARAEVVCELCRSPFATSRAVQPYRKWRIPSVDGSTVTDTGFCIACFVVTAALLLLQYGLLHSIVRNGYTESVQPVCAELLVVLTIGSIIFLKESAVFLVPLWRALRAANTYLTIVKPTSNRIESEQ